MDIINQSLVFVKSHRYEDFTLRQLALFGLLCDTDGPHKVAALAKELGVQKPIITRAADRLIKEGYIKRHPDPNDGRGCILVTTTIGRMFREAVRHLHS